MGIASDGENNTGLHGGHTLMHCGITVKFMMNHRGAPKAPFLRAAMRSLSESRTSLLQDNLGSRHQQPILQVK